MRRAVPVFLVLSALVALGGCGDGDKTSSSTSTSPTTTTSTSPAAATTTPATTTPSTSSSKKNADSPYVVVTSLLGKPLPKEPGCQFAKTFVPANPSAAAYDGSLALTVTCQKEAGYTPTGQVVNRPGSKPTEITCRDTSGGQLYCIYVPSTSVGLYFTGTDRATVRRRLEHLIEVVSPLPTGITPLAGTSTP
jgi:hypothetical protein